VKIDAAAALLLKSTAFTELESVPELKIEAYDPLAAGSPAATTRDKVGSETPH
jgi:hypothetical protein